MAISAGIWSRCISRTLTRASCAIHRRAWYRAVRTTRVPVGKLAVVAHPCCMDPVKRQLGSSTDVWADAVGRLASLGMET